VSFRKTAVFLAICTIILLMLAAPAFAVQQKNIAVSKVGPDSAVLVVKADVASDVTVEYGTSPGSYLNTRTSDGLVRHEVLLDSLAPSSTVYYRVTISDSSDPLDSITLPEKSFHTTRSAGESFRYAVSGDNRPWSNTTVQPAMWSTIVGQMVAEGPDLALNVGDIIYGVDTDNYAQNDAKYDGLSASTTPLTVTAPFYVAAGNHERLFAAVSRAGYEREFTFPVNDGAEAATYGEHYYSFDNGDTHFIALSTEIPGQEGMITGSQKAWLEQDLAANTSRWTVVFMHRPLYAGMHANDPWVNLSNSAGQQNRSDILALFSQYQVDLVFEGHEHFYHHHVDGDTHYVVTGGGGAPPSSPPPLGAGDVFAASAYEHVLVDETASMLTVTAVNSSGATLESFTIGSPAPALGLQQDRVYWGSYADYVLNDLSVDYTLTNSGGDATDVQVVYLVASSMVLPLTETPVLLGDLPFGGTSGTVTIHYLIPSGVFAFRATTYVTCGDTSGGSYAFPGPVPPH